MTTKTCITCHEVKPLDRFYKINAKYYQSYCKPCKNSYTASKYHRKDRTHTLNLISQAKNMFEHNMTGSGICRELNIKRSMYESWKRRGLI